MPLRPFVLALALPLCAQAPFDHLVAANRSASASAPGLFVVDPESGVMTPLRVTNSTSVATGYRTIAFEPTAPNVAYTTSVLSTAITATLWPLTMDGNEAVRTTVSVNLNGGQPIRLRAAPGFGLLILGRGALTGNRMFLRDMVTGTVTPQPSSNLLPGTATDLAVIGNRAFASSEGSTTVTQGVITEWDLAANTERVLGSSYPPITAMAPMGGVLLVGDSTGALHVVDPVTGNATPFLATGLGRIASIAVTSTGRVFFATNPGNGSLIYEATNLQTPRFRTGGILDDLKASPAATPTFLTFGTGCAGSSARNPTLGHVGMPGLGGTFQVTLANGPATGGALLVLGSSRTADAFGPLPRDLGGFGMPGCEQLVDALATVFTGVAGGAAAFPIQVPNSLALIGVQVPMQWLVIDPPANAAGATTSSGGEAHLR